MIQDMYIQEIKEGLDTGVPRSVKAAGVPARQTQKHTQTIHTHQVVK